MYTNSYTNSNGTQKLWGFTHIIDGKDKDIAIAHIEIRTKTDVYFEWCVVYKPHYDELGWYRGLKYTLSYDEAKEWFYQYMESDEMPF